MTHIPRILLLTLLAFILVVSFSLLIGEVFTDPTTRRDGTYKAASEAESCGYLTAEITIEEEEIVHVSLTEYDNKGRVKDETYPYEPWHEAMDVLSESFVKADGPEVDAVSSATKTSHRAMNAVDRALSKSKGNTGPFDGYFMGVSEDEDGRGIAIVRLDDGNIVDVVLEEIDESEEFIEGDYDHQLWYDAQDKLKTQFIENNTHKVDVFTGATVSSERWIEAVKHALENAGKIN